MADRIPSLAEAGGEAALPADALFGLGLLLDWQAWPFLVGETADTAGPRVSVAPETHARYHGRGAFGGHTHS